MGLRVFLVTAGIHLRWQQWADSFRERKKQNSTQMERMNGSPIFDLFLHYNPPPADIQLTSSTAQPGSRDQWRKITQNRNNQGMKYAEVPGPCH